VLRAESALVLMTISNFTPKPHTPFQWHSVTLAEFERKQAYGKNSAGSKVKVNYTDVRMSAMEDFVGRGDRRPPLCSVARTGGVEWIPGLTI